MAENSSTTNGADQLTDVFEDACNLSTSWDDFDLDYNPCPFGDLVVILSNGAKKTSFLVSNLALRMASQVWNKSLDPESPFTKDRERENVDVRGRSIQVFELHDDDPAALLVVFWIIHCRHEEVPKSVSFNQLRSLAVICDKYNCTAAIAPTTEPWLQYWADHALEDGHEDWLFIGPTFGEPRNFEPLTRKLIHGISRKPLQDGDQRNFDLYLKNGLLDVALIPQMLLDSVMWARNRIFRFQMNLLYLFLLKLKYAAIKNGDDIYQPADKPEDVKLVEGILGSHEYLKTAIRTPLIASYTCKESCISMAYGSFIRNVERLGLETYILGDISSLQASRKMWNGNVTTLLKQLESFSVLTHGKEFMGECGLANFENDLRSLAQADTLAINLTRKRFFGKYERRFGEWRSINVP